MDIYQECKWSLGRVGNLCKIWKKKYGWLILSLILGNTYNLCTEAKWTKFWCSTFINDTNHHQGRRWGHCKNSCPINEVISDQSWLIMIGVGSFILFFILILLTLYCTGKLRCLDTTNHYTFTIRKCCINNCFSVKDAKARKGLELEWWK